MPPLYPLTFHPRFKERIWGGRQLETLYQKLLPAGVPIGESWEIADRPDDVSVIANGSLAGRDLRWLMEHHPGELLGNARSQHGRFPLLVKILDAQDKLSLQVHPPARRAVELGGEPKTEMWYLTATTPGADLYVGLRHGVTREEFIRRIRDGTVAGCFHRLEVQPGDAMFLPSGRVHAIGAGNVIFEIQQNSDTTYRVFDWNRVGLDGQPRALHVEQSLASIDFDDFEPALAGGGLTKNTDVVQRSLVRDPLFTVEEWETLTPKTHAAGGGRMEILGAIAGTLTVTGADQSVKLAPGQFCLVPASVADATLSGPAKFLRVGVGN